MDESCVCEVVGCGNKACWLLVVRQDGSSEDFLCHLHWELLHQQDSRRASRYTQLSSLLAEGMGLTAVASMRKPPRICGSSPTPVASHEQQIYDAYAIKDDVKDGTRDPSSDLDMPCGES